MNKVFDIIFFILALSTVFIEFYMPGNYLLLTILYCIGILYLLYRIRIVVLNKEFYEMENWKTKAMAIFKLLVLYFALGRMLFVLTNWTEFPLYLFIPRALFFIIGGVIPIIYVVNGWRKKAE